MVWLKFNWRRDLHSLVVRFASLHWRADKNSDRPIVFKFLRGNLAGWYSPGTLVKRACKKERDDIHGRTFASRLNRFGSKYNFVFWNILKLYVDFQKNFFWQNFLDNSSRSIFSLLSSLSLPFVRIFFWRWILFRFLNDSYTNVKLYNIEIICIYSISYCSTIWNFML